MTSMFSFFWFFSLSFSSPFIVCSHLFFRSLYGKKGAGGVVVVKTGQAIIVGVYNDKQQPGNAANVVEKLGDYLRENGY
jgi:Profilin